jgi:hypothetical protein
MPELVLVAAGNGVLFDFRLNSDVGPTSIILRHVNGAQFDFQLSSPFSIPQDLVASGPAGTKRLLTFDEMRAHAVSKNAEIEDAWQAQLANLSRLEVSIQRAASGAAMIGGVAVTPSATTAVRAILTLNLRDAVMNAATLDAELRVNASCTVSVAGTQLATVLAVFLRIGAVGPRLSFALPEFPLRFPELALPDLNWSKLTAVAWEPIRLPAIPFLPVEVVARNVTFTGNTLGGTLTCNFAIDSVDVGLHGKPTETWFRNVALDLSGGQLSVAFTGMLPTLNLEGLEARLPNAKGPVKLSLGPGSKLELRVRMAGGTTVVLGWLVANLTVASVVDASRKLSVKMTLPFEGDKLVSSLEPGDGNLVSRSFQLEVSPGEFRGLDLAVGEMPAGLALDLRFPEELLDALATLAHLLAQLLSAVGEALSGLAQMVHRVVQALAERVVGYLSALDMTLVLDKRTGSLQQVLFNIHRAQSKGPLEWDKLGFRVRVPADVDLALMLDFREGRRDAYFIVTAEAGLANPVVEIGTDLWFSTPDTERPAGELGPTGKQPPRLLKVDVMRTDPAAPRTSLVPLGLRDGRATFLHALSTALPTIGNGPSIDAGGYELVEVPQVFKTEVSLDKDAAGKLLPFLSAPSDGTKGSDSSVNSLKQYIKIEPPDDKFEVQHGVARAPIKAKITALDGSFSSTLDLQVELRTLSARVSGGQVDITVKDHFDLFGMKGEFKANGQTVTEKQFVLDLRGSDSRLYLKDGVELFLNFKMVSTTPLKLKVSRFVMHGGGLDLEAELVGQTKFPLNGLGTDFTFKTARLSVRNSRPSAFTLDAKGKLPPDLLGDVDSELHLSFGMKDDKFKLLDGSLELANKGKPIRSEQTHFVFTLDGVAVRVFEDAGILHFCAFISGSAEFKPEAAELANGMFKKLAGVKLSFTDCPVCGASDVIERELQKLNLSFIVTLDEPARANLFELFKFEVRSIGLEPRCKQFDDTPAALVIGGQVAFADTGDVVRAECDFHKIYIAPPKPDTGHSPKLVTGLPRIKCEGLGVGIRLGSAFAIEGKVTAVDGMMTNVLVSAPPKDRLKGSGFMGQGRIAIEGLPPMAASFGFVEISKGDWSRRAWFVYLEAQHLSYHFQLGPVPVYLREVGLGLGYHFTYVGISEIDRAPSLPEILGNLYKIASTAIEPATVGTWVTEREPGLTLVARAILSMSSASAPSEPLVWKPEDEKELPNIVLLNVLMAMRNTTFMMTANAWLGWNYHDWDEKRKLGQNDLVGKQGLTGYIVVVGSRSEFLARLKGSTGAEVGPRLALPDTFKSALKEVEYDATLYIRPGLLHFELGWPNRIRWSKNIAGANLTVAGGAIFRVHESNLLVGLNLEGQLSFAMSGSLDAGVVGISVSASVYAALAARIIGYLDAKRASDSLYYSLFSLQVRVQFAVSAWLQIDAWLCKITIRASFAISLQVDVLAELAIGGDGSLGTRMRATIAISVFGRSLGLSVGLAMNPSLVDAAQARVSRFMQLGLVQEIPSVSPPLGKQDARLQDTASTGQEKRDAQATAALANASRPDNLAPVPHEEKEIVGNASKGTDGLEIWATDFQVIASYPLAMEDAETPSEWVYLTFLPIDATDNDKSSFYAAPKSDVLPPPVDHYVDFTKLKLQPDEILDQWNGKDWVKVSSVADIPTLIDWGKVLPFEESTQAGHNTPAVHHDVATLKKLFFAAFRTIVDEKEKNEEKLVQYFEPSVRAKREPADSRAEAKPDIEKTHLDQQRAYAAAIHVDPADRRCYEARDFLIYKFISDLFAYAADGTKPSTSTAHILDLGLTFRVKKEVIERLKDDELRDIAIVKKRVIVNGATTYKPSKPCALFNPPRMTFAERKPEFDARDCDCTDGKVKLDWVLNWDASKSAEDYLQYYEVRRWINLGTDEFESDAMRVIRADREVLKDNVRYIERAEWQFTDEFEDLDAEQRRKLQEAGGTAVIRYSITPVCVSNTRGRTCSRFVLRYGGWPELKAPMKAEATLTLNPEAKDDERLGVELKMEVENTKLPGTRCWEILLRPEQIVPAGQYGSDAEVQRSLGGWLASSSIAQPADYSIRVAIKESKDKVIKFILDQEKANEIRDQFTDTKNPRAWRIRARQIVVDNKRADASSISPYERECEGTVLTSSPWTEVEIAVLLRRKIEEKDKGKNVAPQYVFLKPPFFEYIRQARGPEATMLDAVPFDGLAPVDSGPATLVVPDGDAPRSILHPEFGAASCLSWNVVPSGLDDAALVPWRMLAGFDVMRLDLDGADKIEPQDWRRANRVTSTRLLDADTVRLLPGEIGDAANWKAAYPSLTARRRAGGAWYSAAESYIEWPPLGHRLEAVPEPSSDLLAALLRNGVPDAIVVGVFWEPPPEKGNPEDELPPTAPTLDWSFALRPVQGKEIPWALTKGTNRLVFTGNSKEDAASLREALRRLEIQANPKAETFRPESPLDVVERIPASDLRRWQLTLTAVLIKKDVDAEIAKQTIPLNLDQCLHPVLESILVRMRRFERTQGEVALLDVDRRPPPVVKAKTPMEFFGATQDAADPHGWVVLDRLGLGVTLRLFDPLHDKYLDRTALQKQFECAVKELEAEGMHSDALKHLSVDWLLQPGQLLRTMPFEERPDQHGFVGAALDKAWLDDASLSMMRISVRPRIRKRYSYLIKKYNLAALKDFGSGTFSAMLLEDGIAKENADKAVLEEMLREAARAADPSASIAAIEADDDVERVVLIRYTNTLEGVNENDSAPGRTGGDLVDAFGRFPALSWDQGADGQLVTTQLDRFWQLLLNVTPFESKKDAEKPIIPEWLKYNQRFFEHASGAPGTCKVTYSYAATEATEPVLVAPDDYGRATVVLPEADGYAHQFAYAVKPQWRYRAILESAGYTVEADPPPLDPPQPTPYVIGTVERTAPVLPPALISLGLVGDRIWWESKGELIVRAPGEKVPDGAIRLGSDAGVSAALLLPHHLERRLARANLPAQRNLAHAGELFTQLSMPVDPHWCESILGRLPFEPQVRPHAHDADTTIATTAELDKLATSDLSFERARLRLVSYLPHWYRSIAAVAAASGTQASVPAVTYLPESAARLVLANRDAKTLALVSEHPWTGKTKVDASGEQRVELETVDRPSLHAGIKLTIPLLRYRDTTDAVTAKLWAGDISTVPDPGVAYQIDLVAPRRKGEPRDSVTPIARMVRTEFGKCASFRVMPISRDWQVCCEMTTSGDGRSLDVHLSPLGAPLGGPEMVDVTIAGVERDPNGALHAPGGWSFEWITPLFGLLKDGGVNALSQVTKVFRAIGEDGIGVPDDGTGFFVALPSVQLARMQFTKPTSAQQWTELTRAFDDWQLKNEEENGKRITQCVRKIFQDSEGKDLWPFPQDKGDLDIPWLPQTMHEPASGLLGFQLLSAKRFLLPELMTEKIYDKLRKKDPERAKLLWQVQKDKTMGTRRIVITAQRGDSIPLQMLPFYLA